MSELSKLIIDHVAEASFGCEQCQSLYNDRKQLKKDRQELIDELKFYSKASNWEIKTDHDEEDAFSSFLKYFSFKDKNDGGKRAREVLKKMGVEG